MSTDAPKETTRPLPERLRSLRNGWNDPNEVLALASEAAVEIERLRAEIAAMRARDMRDMLTGRKPV